MYESIPRSDTLKQTWFVHSFPHPNAALLFSPAVCSVIQESVGPLVAPTPLRPWPQMTLQVSRLWHHLLGWWVWVPLLNFCFRSPLGQREISQRITWWMRERIHFPPGHKKVICVYQIFIKLLLHTRNLNAESRVPCLSKE